MAVCADIQQTDSFTDKFLMENTMQYFFVRQAYRFFGAFFTASAILGTMLITLIVTQNALAQTTTGQGTSTRPTSVQILHNAADPAVAIVNLWTVNSVGTPPPSAYSRTIQGFSFGNATPLLTGFGSGSGSVSDISFDSSGIPRFIATFTDTSITAATPAYLRQSVRLAQNAANIVITSGVFRPELFMPNPSGVNTNLQFFQFIDTANTVVTTNTAVATNGTVRLLLFHGVTDAPSVDVVVRGKGNIGTLTYGKGAFVTVPLGDYVIDLTLTTSQSVIASFAAPLESLNFGGGSVTLAAGGFWYPAQNQNGSPLGFTAALSAADSTGLGFLLPVVAGPSFVRLPSTSVQIIDNSPDASRLRAQFALALRPAQSTTGGLLAQVASLVFREATFVNSTFAVLVPTGGRNPPRRVVVSYEDVIGAQIASPVFRAATTANGRPRLDLTNVPTAFVERGVNTMIAIGVADTTQYAPNPDKVSTRIKLVNVVDAQDTVDSASVRVLLYHGVTDMPRVDIVVRGGDTLASLRYGEGKLLTLPAALPMIVDVVQFGTQNVIGALNLPLPAFAGQRLSIMASGYLDPTKNLNGRALDFLAVPQNSAAFLTPTAALPPGVAETTLQFVHASADASLTPIGSVVGYPISTRANLNVALAQGLRFRGAGAVFTGLGDAAPFLKDIVGVGLRLSITPGNSTNANAALFSVPFSIVRGANVFLASGFRNPLLYAPNPEQRPTALNAYRFIDQTRSIMPDSTRMLLFHGVSDAPRVDIAVRTVTTNSVVATLGYGEGAYVTVGATDCTIDLLVPGTQTAITSFSVPLNTLGLGSKRVIVSATGFLRPAANQNLSPLRLHLATHASDSTGTPLLSMLLPNAFTPEQAAAEGALSVVGTLRVFPSPATDQVSFAYSLREASSVSITLFDTFGQLLKTVENGIKSSGDYTVTINTSTLPTGSYHVRLVAQNGVQSGTILIVR
jgi:hypothetical protein